MTPAELAAGPGFQLPWPPGFRGLPPPSLSPSVPCPGLRSPGNWACLELPGARITASSLLSPRCCMGSGLLCLYQFLVTQFLAKLEAGTWRHFVSHFSWAAFCPPGPLLSQVSGELSPLIGDFSSLLHPKHRERGGEGWQHSGHCHVAQCQGALFTWPAVRFAPPGAVSGWALADRNSTGSSPRSVPPQLLACSCAEPARCGSGPHRALPSSSQLFTWAPPC